MSGLIAFLLVAATSPLTPLMPGQIVDGVACPADPAVTYAYYLPSHYTVSNRYPILFVFDPRKRGAFGAELFREAAEQYGWIVVSSNNTESDTDAQPSIHAIETMLPDAQHRFSVDTKRVYLAGFSGTAIIAWAVAEVTKSVAGVIGCSGRPLPDRKYNIPFAWFGTAGTYDFNYSETFEIERGLAAAGAKHHVEIFDGPHRWAPQDILRRGVEWMELHAMKSGVRSRDDVLVKRLLDEEVARAAGEHDPLAAVRRYESIIRTFDGLAAVEAARTRAAEIRSSREFKSAEREEKRALDLEQTYRSRSARVLQEFLNSDSPQIAPALAHALDIQTLLDIARRPSPEGHAAQRVLEGLHAQLSFYLPRETTGAKLTAMKTVAAMIHPPKS